MGITNTKRLLAPLRGTIASGETATLAIGLCDYLRVVRDATSSGTLHYVTSAGGDIAVAAERYDLTAVSPDTGRMPVGGLVSGAPTTLTLGATGGDCDYTVERIG